MKKEVVVMIDHSGARQIDVAAKDKKIEKFALHHPVVDFRIITYQPDLLVNLIGQNVTRCEILDFECLDKQIRQSTELDVQEGKWNIPNMLSAYLDIEEKDWSFDERDEILRLLADCYLVMKEKGAGEWKRIEEIEIPVNKILYGAQLKGCYFNHDRIAPLCAELHRKIYGYKNQVQLELGFTGDDLETYLRFKEIRHNTLDDNEIKHLCKQYPELTPFRKLRRDKRNLNCLISLSAYRKDTNTCTPIFKGFGSSTGRIFMRDPSLQNLSRKFRGLLKNENLPYGYRYVYVDFGQFEAGILAGITGNKDLQKIYEDDVLYEKLAGVSKMNDRESAKVAFYCYVYGGIISKGTESFFETYGLKDIIDNVVKGAKQQGYIESPLGNRRIVKKEGDDKWIMNHYIQGTSSLIFKQALIDVFTSFQNKAELLMPMHDAALYLVDTSISTDSIINTFKRAFNKWIPKSKPVVKEKYFFEE